MAQRAHRVPCSPTRIHTGTEKRRCTLDDPLPRGQRSSGIVLCRLGASGIRQNSQVVSTGAREAVAGGCQPVVLTHIGRKRARCSVAPQGRFALAYRAGAAPPVPSSRANAATMRRLRAAIRSARPCPIDQHDLPISGAQDDVARVHVSVDDRGRAREQPPANARQRSGHSPQVADSPPQSLATRVARIWRICRKLQSRSCRASEVGFVVPRQRPPAAYRTMATGRMVERLPDTGTWPLRRSRVPVAARQEDGRSDAREARTRPPRARIPKKDA